MFDNVDWSAQDTGTITMVEVSSPSSVVVNVDSGTSTYGGYWGSGTGVLDGHLIKSGAGAYEANHFRVAELTVDGGTLRALQEGSGPVGGTLNTSRVNTLTIAGGSIATARLDLMNNELIIDWTGTDPLGAGTASVLVKQLLSGRNSGSWNGNGIVTSLGAGSAVLGIGYVNQPNLQGGTTVFSGQTIDSTTTVLKMTYTGDQNLDGDVDIDDFANLGAFNTPQLWSGGDFTYDGIYNTDDFALLTAAYNYGTGGSNPPQLRGGSHVSPLIDIYVLMLDMPELYWTARDWTEFWNQYYAPFDAMNLGAIPPRPEQNRSVPEPATALVVLYTTALLRRRR